MMKVENINKMAKSCMMKKWINKTVEMMNKTMITQWEIIYFLLIMDKK